MHLHGGDVFALDICFDVHMGQTNQMTYFPHFAKTREWLLIGLSCLCNNLCLLRAILCKYGASYIGAISRSDSDLDETCWQCQWSCKNKKSSVSSSNSTSVAMATASKDLGQKRSKKHMKNDIFTIKLL